MKKLLLLTAIALTACSKDNEGCQCKAKYGMPGKTTYFYVNDQPVDCESGNPTKIHQSGYFIECV